MKSLILLMAVVLVGCAISPKETLPGTYALDEGGVIVMILRKNGTVENYTLGEFDGGKKTYKTVGKEVHILDWEGTSVFKIEPNGDLILIAKITKGKREKLQEEAVLPPWKRVDAKAKTTSKETSSPWVSDPSNPQNAIVEYAIREALEKPEGELITKADLEKVRYLGVIDNQFTDEGLKEVAKLQQLESLTLGGTKLTNVGLKEVAKLRKLTELELAAEQITDAGLKELVKCKQLKALGLADTQITDTGLKEIAKLQQLTFLDLSGTKVTEVGVAELKKALPKCEIISNPTK